MQSPSSPVHKLYRPAGIAIHQLYERYGSIIYGIILQYETEKTKAGNLLIDVFEEAGALLPAYNASRQPLFIWLYRLLVLRLRDDYPAIIQSIKRGDYNDRVVKLMPALEQQAI